LRRLGRCVPTASACSAICAVAGTGWLAAAIYAMPTVGRPPTTANAFLLNVTASTVGPVTSERKREAMREQIASGARSYPLPTGRWPTPPAWRSLAAVRPELVAEWHPMRNRKLEALGVNPRTVGARSNREVWWRCRVCGHEWQSRVSSRRDSGCPACHVRKLRERSLAVLHPHLLTEWHSERNGDLDPYLVAASSERRAWWRCQTCGHEWASLIKNRTLGGKAAPSASGERALGSQPAMADGAGRESNHWGCFTPSCSPSGIR
jgi:rubrerythrin